MAPDWEKLGEEWKDHAVGMIADVDCTEEGGKPLCEDYGVEGFPTLMYGDPAAPEVRNVKCGGVHWNSQRATLCGRVSPFLI